MNAAVDSLSNSFSPSKLKTLIRIFASLLAISVLLFLLSRLLIFWYDWPSLSSILGLSSETIEASQKTRGIILLLLYALAFAIPIFFIKRTPNRSLNVEAESYKNISYFVVRAAFWSVFLIGFADAVISFLRVE